MKILFISLLITASMLTTISCQHLHEADRADTSTIIDQPLVSQCASTKQLKFDMEDHVVCEKTLLPQSIWEQVVTSDGSKHFKSQLSESDEPSRWVDAAHLDINFDSVPDYVVVAVEPPLAGPNVTPFWIYLSTSSGYKCVLSTTALSLEFSDSPSNGFRNVKVSWVSGDEYTISNYHFVSKEYRMAFSETKKIN
jgi:hypothetical protein